MHFAYASDDPEMPQAVVEACCELYGGRAAQQVRSVGGEKCRLHIVSMISPLLQQDLAFHETDWFEFC